MKTVSMVPLITLGCLLALTSDTTQGPIVGILYKHHQEAGKSPPLDPRRLGESHLESLYSRLGGRKVITAFVHEFISNIAEDSRINKLFVDAAMDPKRLGRFKGNLVDQICQASGGPCKYKGKDMKAAHKEIGITDVNFNAFLEDFAKALDTFNVAATEKNELLGLLGRMKSEIVGQ